MKVKKLESVMTDTAKKVSEYSINSACLVFLYQPSISKEMMKKLKKQL